VVPVTGGLVLAGVPVMRAVQEEFPAYRIWREVIRGRSCYVACSRRIGVRPHTLVTPDLDELRAGLLAGPARPGDAAVSLDGGRGGRAVAGEPA
jgi:hypothetical protein